MKFYVIYDPNSNTKSSIQSAIAIVNQLQGEYLFEDSSQNASDYTMFSKREVDIDEQRGLLSRLDKHTIFVINAPFSDNFFSHDGRNYNIVTTDSWDDYFAPPSVKVYLMYMFAEIALKFSGDLTERFQQHLYHQKATGCINDFWGYKEEITISIRAGFICPECRATYPQYGISSRQLEAVEEILLAARAVALGKPLPHAIASDPKKIFIVHGRNDGILNEVSDYLEQLGLTPVILKRLRQNGINTILNQISQNSNVSCAIILFTADDVGKLKEETLLEKRARQNVVFETGYFLGKLGKERVLMMAEKDVKLPSDLGGCLYIDLDENWKTKLADSLKSMPQLQLDCKSDFTSDGR